MLLSYNLNLEKVKLPAVSVFLAIQPSYDIFKEQGNHEISVQELNTEQREVFETVLVSVYNNQTKSSKHIFFSLDGLVGSGKTFPYTTFLYTSHIHTKYI